ncbi:hypothetical protein BB560_000099 [Smittium megazygosporum]|uniref:Uncharacterized protein n=1 Tax=Smittium megazygosporum TaxID=133381 RepID=A0A2T9ZLD0_9FUNG|nr:hypothetical protein BB560_000099 [Smittium megazygosporum]
MKFVNSASYVLCLLLALNSAFSFGMFANEAIETGIAKREETVARNFLIKKRQEEGGNNSNSNSAEESTSDQEPTNPLAQSPRMKKDKGETSCMQKNKMYAKLALSRLFVQSFWLPSSFVE